LCFSESSTRCVISDIMLSNTVLKTVAV
jgi:hypothetical protein